MRRSEIADAICMADSSERQLDGRSDVRTYRTQHQAIIGWALAIFIVGMGVVALVLPTARGHGGYVIAPIALVGAVGMARFALCGVRVSAGGVRVANILHTRDLAWEQVKEFRLSQFGACQIELKDGTWVSIVGIEQSNLAGMAKRQDTPERRMITGLNQLLREHTGGGAQPPPNSET